MPPLSVRPPGGSSVGAVPPLLRTPGPPSSPPASPRTGTARSRPPEGGGMKLNHDPPPPPPALIRVAGGGKSVGPSRCANPAALRSPPFPPRLISGRGERAASFKCFWRHCDGDGDVCGRRRVMLFWGSRFGRRRGKPRRMRFSKRLRGPQHHPQGSGQAFLETLVPEGILVLCNIFRGFSLHGQAKVTQS